MYTIAQMCISAYSVTKFNLFKHVVFYLLDFKSLQIYSLSGIFQNIFNTFYDQWKHLHISQIEHINIFIYLPYE